MKSQIFTMLGEALRTARKTKGLTQSQLAKRLGREQGRVSELETDLARGRMGKDRLTLLVEMCDALDLVPVLLPRAEALSRTQVSPAPGSPPLSAHVAPRSAFDELFIDLGEDEEDEDHEERQAGPHG